MQLWHWGTGQKEICLEGHFAHQLSRIDSFNLCTQEVKVFILQPDQRIPPICCKRTCKTTRHNQINTLARSLLKRLQQELTYKMCLSLQIALILKELWKEALIYPQSLSPTYSQAHTLTLIPPNWCGFYRFPRSTKATLRGESSFVV